MSQSDDRVAWIDFAKGGTILLIALHHAGAYERAIFGNHWGELVFQWSNIDMLLYHIRLPLFFFISGMVASGHFSSRSDRQIWLTARGYALLYLLWALVMFYLMPFWPDAGLRQDFAWSDLAKIGIGGSVIWYVWAILICRLIAHATSPFPGWAVIVGAVGAHALFDLVAPLPGAVPAMARSLPFYLLGFRYPQLGSVRNVQAPPLIVATFTLLLAILLWSRLSDIWAAAALDLVGLGLGIVGARMLVARCQPLVPPLLWLGRRTLCIYILHFPIIALLGDLSVIWLGPLPLGHPLIVVLAPALAAAAVLGSLAIHAAFERVGLGWLFLPKAFVGRERRRQAAAYP